MLAAYAVSQSSSDPLSGLVIGPRPDPVARPGWSVVKLRAAGLNHHDVWSLRGVELYDGTPAKFRHFAWAGMAGVLV